MCDVVECIGVVRRVEHAEVGSVRIGEVIVLKESFVIVVESHQEKIFWNIKSESAVDDVVVPSQHEFGLIDGVCTQYLING